jgi:hypothetical protein
MILDSVSRDIRNFKNTWPHVNLEFLLATSGDTHDPYIPKAGPHRVPFLCSNLHVVFFGLFYDVDSSEYFRSRRYRTQR